MKTNLNIAYLNGAEGMIRRGAASSGGSGSGESESSWRYFDMSKLKPGDMALTMYFVAIIKTTVSDTYGKPLFISAGSMMGLTDTEPTNLVAVPTNIPMTYEGGEVATFEEGCIKYNVTDEDLAVGEITKEQFYSLE